MENGKESFQRVEKKTEVKNSIVRAVVVVALVVLQFWWLWFLITRLEQNIPWFSTAISYVTLILLITIYTRHMNASYRMFWMIIVAGFPILGIPFYILMGRQNSTKRMRDKFAEIDEVLFTYVKDEKDELDELERDLPEVSAAAHYLSYTAKFPVYKNTETLYFADGAEGFEDQLREIEKAKHYVFMEYFAFEEKGAFQRLFEILKRKVAEGVEVRIIYDDIGSLTFINKEFIHKMVQEGIHCVRFNPIVPIANIFLNNRDHRKITVIDGYIAYTGGYNIANEYFHITEPYGYWKDSGVRIKGEAAFTFTGMFLEMWNLINRTDVKLDADRFLKRSENIDRDADAIEQSTEPSTEDNAGTGTMLAQDGYVQPFADSPLDGEPVGEEVYMNLLRSAKDYIWFVTPYLLITDEMRREMVGAAKRGVDVRIITPGIPDKKIVYQETRSYYSGLVRGGVRIYEYTPGFCHAKLCVTDDKAAMVGTINLDYRSLYLHFEDGVMFYQNHVVDDVKCDVEKMLSESEEVTQKYTKSSQLLIQRTYRALLRLLAPML